MGNRDIEARLKISAYDRTGAVLSRIANKLGLVSSKADQVNRKNGLIAASSKRAGIIMGKWLAPAVVTAGAVKAVKDFATLERQMTRIGITAGATEKETEEALKSVQALAKEFALPFQEGVEALDTLVASGLSLNEALDFLPSVLATAQAAGAATTDIANTAIKAASALKLPAEEMQRAFDIMVTGGKEGQFELKDMAQHIPELANSFASLGYEGEEGLKKLIAVLQTLREDTGSASAAATQAGNLFGKMYSEETARRFKDFGIDLRKEMEAAQAAGKDAVDAFVTLSSRAIDGDMTKLPQLFTDQEFRLAMQSLITSTDSLERFYAAMNSAEIDGTVFRDLQRVLKDTQADIDNLSSSWGRMWTSMGSAVSDPASAAMNTVADDLDYGAAIRKQLESQGMGYAEREFWFLKNMPFGGLSKSEESDQLAYEGGFRGEEMMERRAERQRERDFPQQNALMYLDFGEGTTKSLPTGADSVGGLPFGYVPPDFTGLGFGSDVYSVSQEPTKTPIQESIAVILGEGEAAKSSFFENAESGRISGKGDAPKAQSGADEGAEKIGQAVSAGADDVRKDLQAGSQTIGRAFADGAEEVRRAGNEGGAKVRSGADDVARALSDAASTIDAATKQLSGAALRRENRVRRKANFNPGQSMKPEDNAPPGAY